MPTDYIGLSFSNLTTAHRTTRSECQQLANLRLQEATSFLDHYYPDGAFYLAGYAVECALKAAISRTLGIDDFFEPYSSKSHSLKVEDDIVQKFKCLLNTFSQKVKSRIFAALIPSHTFYKNELYVIILSIPTLSRMTSGTMNGLIIDKWFAFTTQDDRRHMSTVLTFSTVDAAQRYIASQDIDEFVIPVLEPAHT